MRQICPWRGFSMLTLAACLAGCADPNAVELSMVLQVDTDAAVLAETARPAELTPQQVEQVRRLAVAQTIDAIRNRLDQIGLADEAVIKEQPGHRILLRLPAPEDPQRMSRLLRTTGLLELRFVRFPVGGGGAFSREAILEHFDGQVPTQLEILEGDLRNERGEVTGKMYYAVEKDAVITGRDIRSARPNTGQFQDPIVEFRLKPDAAAVFSEATSKNIGSGLAMVLDGRVMSAPVVTSRIGEYGVIQGAFTQAEVEDMAAVLRAGALPVRVTLVEERILGPGKPLRPAMNGRATNSAP